MFKANRPLPQEVLDRVFNSLSIADVENTADYVKSIKDSEFKIANTIEMNSVLDEKLDPIKYLGRMFTNPAKLFYNMGLICMILSGSRAVEYFIPGICRESSDWDFYCNNTEDSVFAAMRVLEDAGVVWKPRNGYIGASDEEDDIISNTEDGYNLDICHLVTGTITKNGITNNIQLVYSVFEDKPIELVSRFHSSIVQSFIGFGGACHMYYKAALEKKSYYWYQQATITPYIFEKYSTKEVTFVNRFNDHEFNTIDEINKLNTDILRYSTDKTNDLENMLLRTMTDNESKFVSFFEYNKSKVTMANTKYYYSGNPITSTYDLQGKGLSYHISQSTLAMQSIVWYERNHNHCLMLDVPTRIANTGTKTKTFSNFREHQHSALLRAYTDILIDVQTMRESLVNINEEVGNSMREYLNEKHVNTVTWDEDHRYMTISI